MKRVWFIVSIVLAITALVLFLGSDYEKAFVAAAIGAVAWMLSYRAQMRELINADQAQKESGNNQETDEEE